MITESESGLSAADYAALSQQENLIYKAILETHTRTQGSAYFTGVNVKKLADSGMYQGRYLFDSQANYDGTVYIAYVDGTADAMYVKQMNPTDGTVIATLGTYESGTTSTITNVKLSVLLTSSSYFTVYYTKSSGGVDTIYAIRHDNGVNATYTVTQAVTGTKEILSESSSHMTNATDIVDSGKNTLVWNSDPEALRDDNDATYWQSDHIKDYIKFWFSTNKCVSHFKIKASDWPAGTEGKSAKKMPKSFKLQWSTDNVNWTTAQTYVDQTNWKALEERVYPTYIAGGEFARYWRIKFLENNGNPNRISFGNLDIILQTMGTVNGTVIAMGKSANQRDYVFYVYKWPDGNVRIVTSWYNSGTDSYLQVSSNIYSGYTWLHYVHDIVGYYSGPDWQNNKIVLLTEWPGYTQLVAENGTVREELSRGQAIIQISMDRFNATEYSNTYDLIDRIDIVEEYRHFQGLSLAIDRDKSMVKIVTYEKIGLEEGDMNVLREYTTSSKSGYRFWSKGEILPRLSSANSIWYGDCIAGYSESDRRWIYARYNHIYSFAAPNIDGLLPGSTTQFEEDITANIIDHSFDISNGFSASLTLMGKAITLENKVHLIHHYFGVYDAVQDKEIFLKRATTIVEAAKWSDSADDSSVSLECRDVIGMLDTKAVSEEPHYWNTQLQAGDHFDSVVSEGNGGLSHSAIKAGAWETQENTITLLDENKLGIVFNTNGADLVNGLLSATFVLPNTDSEFGFVFRAQDEHTFFAVVYYWTNYATDTYTCQLRLYKKGLGNYIVIADGTPITYSNGQFNDNKLIYGHIFFVHGLVKAYGIVSGGNVPRGEPVIQNGTTLMLNTNIDARYFKDNPASVRPTAIRLSTHDSLPGRGFVGFLGKGTFYENER